MPLKMTDHSVQRARKRLGIPKRSVPRAFAKALKEGVLDGKYLMHKGAVWIVEREAEDFVCITVYKDGR